VLTAQCDFAVLNFNLELSTTYQRRRNRSQ
jgi:hypothetical protein